MHYLHFVYSTPKKIRIFFLKKWAVCLHSIKANSLQKKVQFLFTSWWCYTSYGTRWRFYAPMTTPKLMHSVGCANEPNLHHLSAYFFSSILMSASSSNWTHVVEMVCFGSLVSWIENALPIERIIIYNQWNIQNNTACTQIDIQLVYLIVHLDVFAIDLILRMHCTPLTPIKVIEIVIYSPLKSFLHFFPIYPPIFHHPSI